MRFFKSSTGKKIALLPIPLVIVVVATITIVSDGPDKSTAAKVSGSSITATTTQPPLTTQPASSGKPSAVINLINWEITLPTPDPKKGGPEVITQPALDDFSQQPYFYLSQAGDGAVFHANAGGATTKNSHYPRSELREMTQNGRTEAIWSNKGSKANTMIIRQAITALPPKKPHVVAGQIHDDSDDVVMIRLEKNRLFVEASGKEISLLDKNYTLGKIFTVKITAASGHIKVSYNDSQKVDYKKSGSDYYFKAGCYTQTNTSKGDAPDAYAEVVIYDLQVEHS